MGNSKKLPRVVVVLAGAGLLLLFQNMSLVEFSSLDVPKVDEGSRRDQARELLGTYYVSSSAKKVEGQKHLNYLIFKEVDKALGPQWKHRVLELTQAIIKESQEFEFDPIFVLAVIQTESTFNPSAKGTSGEIGLMQILPKTGEWMAKKYRVQWSGEKTLYDPVMNVKLGVRYFDYLRSQFDGTAYHYVPAYNMGPKNLRRVNREIGSVDANGRVQKREYAMKVMKNYAALYEQLAAEQSKLEQYARASGTLMQ